MQYKRYVTMGLSNGELCRIIARRGEAPDDIVRQTLELIESPYSRKFDALYVMEIGDAGQYGGSTNLKLLKIGPPPSIPVWSLVPVPGHTY